MKNTNEGNKFEFKKPVLVLNDATKMYLATQDVSDDKTDFFLILSLFLPRNKGRFSLEPQTEISTFYDAESASVYHETLKRYCEVNKKRPEAQMFADTIKKFNENAR